MEIWFDRMFDALEKLNQRGQRFVGLFRLVFVLLLIVLELIVAWWIWLFLDVVGNGLNSIAKIPPVRLLELPLAVFGLIGILAIILVIAALSSTK